MSQSDMQSGSDAEVKVVFSNHVTVSCISPELRWPLWYSFHSAITKSEMEWSC